MQKHYAYKKTLETVRRQIIHGKALASFALRLLAGQQATKELSICIINLVASGDCTPCMQLLICNTVN
jgi:hypothetical protein